MIKTRLNCGSEGLSSDSASSPTTLPRLLPACHTVYQVWTRGSKSVGKQRGDIMSHEASLNT